jgi:hypothetical protein
LVYFISAFFEQNASPKKSKENKKTAIEREPFLLATLQQQLASMN